MSSSPHSPILVSYPGIGLAISEFRNTLYFFGSNWHWLWEVLFPKCLQNFMLWFLKAVMRFTCGSQISAQVHAHPFSKPSASWGALSLSFFAPKEHPFKLKTCQRYLAQHEPYSTLSSSQIWMWDGILWQTCGTADPDSAGLCWGWDSEFLSCSWVTMPLLLVPSPQRARGRVTAVTYVQRKKNLNQTKPTKTRFPTCPKDGQ